MMLEKCEYRLPYCINSSTLPSRKGYVHSVYALTVVHFLIFAPPMRGGGLGVLLLKKKEEYLSFCRKGCGLHESWLFKNVEATFRVNFHKMAAGYNS